MQLSCRARIARFFATGALIGLALGAMPTAANAARSDPLSTWETKRIDLPVHGVAYEPTRDVLLGTVDGSNASLGNDLVEFDPQTGAIGRHVFVGSTPWAVAASDDGTVAYVALRNSSRIAQIDLTSFTVTRTFWTTAAGSGPYFADQLAVPPGRDDIVVATLVDQMTWSQVGVIAYQDGIPLPDSVDSPVDTIVFTDATTVYAFDHWATNFALTPYSFMATGLTQAGPRTTLQVGGEGDDIEGAGNGQLITLSGKLVDPATSTILQSYDAKGYVEATPDDNRVTYVDGGTVKQFDLNTGALLGSRLFDDFGADALGLVATRTGFAAPATDGLFLLGPSVTAGPVAVPRAAPATVGLQRQTIVPIHADDLAYDRWRNVVYADDNDALYALDPATGLVLHRLPYPELADQLALADDGSVLYVSLYSVNQVVKIDPVTFREIGRIDLGAINGHDLVAERIEARPGRPNDLAVVFRPAWQDAFCINGCGYFGLAVYADGQRLPDLITTPSSQPRVAFRDTDTLFGLAQGSSGALSKYAVDATGVHAVFGNYWGFSGYGLSIDSDGTAWTGTGRVLDVDQPGFVATMPVTSRIVRNEKLGRIFQIRRDALVEYDRATFRQLGELPLIAEASSYDSAFVGTGFGFATTAVQGILLFNPLACAGQVPTIVATANDVVGTPGDDVILGTTGGDVIDGLGGNDIICGLGGNDTLIGGAGNDTLIGGEGNDRLTGGLGDDDIDGGAGTDLVALGDDAVAHHVDLDNVADDGAAGEADNVRSSNEIIVGSPGPDTIVGTAGRQLLRGGAGRDLLVGLDGNDVLDGGDDNDRLYGGTGDDVLAGGLGADYCVTKAGLDRWLGCETVLR